ncbi:phasin family protein [Ramlibacter sp.]|uniref:phasin family protein n=1 Tax=Ramlibacter sp. TaxID=1917967 RepID=UPI002FC7BCE2
MANTSKRTQQAMAGNGADRAAQQGTAAWAHMARQQMAWAADTMAMLFRAGESIQQAQLHMAQRAALLSQQAAETLRSAETPLELASIQANLLAYEYQEGMRYFQELMQAGAKATATSAKPPREESVTATAADATAQVVEAAMNAAAPMAQAWQQMFTTAATRGAAAHH